MTKENVVKFYSKDATKNADNVLERAIGNYDDVLIIGYNKDDLLDIKSNLDLTHQDILWMIKMFEKKLLDGDYFEENQ